MIHQIRTTEEFPSRVALVTPDKHLSEPVVEVQLLKCRTRFMLSVREAKAVGDAIGKAVVMADMYDGQLAAGRLPDAINEELKGV